MQAPPFDLPVTICDSSHIALTDYALSDVLDWMCNLHRVMGYPRVMLISDEIYDLICRHPQVSQAIRDKVILIQCRTLYFLTLDVVIIADSSIMDCRESVEKRHHNKV